MAQAIQYAMLAKDMMGGNKTAGQGFDQYMQLSSGGGQQQQEPAQAPGLLADPNQTQLGTGLSPNVLEDMIKKLQQSQTGFGSFGGRR
jgi:hypothetical protein